MNTQHRRQKYFVDNDLNLGSHEYLLNLHRLTTVEFSIMVWEYFAPYPVPIPKIFYAADIQKRIEGEPDDAAVGFMYTDSTFVNDISMLPQGAPLNCPTHYSVALFKTILENYPDAQFLFFKGYDTAWQQCRVVFTVLSQDKYVYYCDYSNVEP